MDIKNYLMELYREKYGEKINKNIAEGLVYDMAVTDGSDRENGEKWTIEEAKAAGDKIGVNWDQVDRCEWYVVLNMMYSDYYRTGKKRGFTDSAFYADLAFDWFHDVDGKDNKTFNCFFCS